MQLSSCDCGLICVDVFSYNYSVYTSFSFVANFIHQFFGNMNSETPDFSIVNIGREVYLLFFEWIKWHAIIFNCCRQYIVIHRHAEFDFMFEVVIETVQDYIGEQFVQADINL